MIRTTKDRRPKLLCTGPVVMDKQHFLSDGKVRIYPGGNALIFSCVASRMGIQTVVSGLVGDDQYGQQVRDTLAFYGVDISRIRSLAKESTKLARIEVTPAGTWRHQSPKPEPFPCLDPQIRSFVNSSYSHLHLAGLSSLLRSAPTETCSLIRFCKEQGLTVSAGFGRLAERDVEIAEKAIAATDLVFCNQREFFTLTKTEKSGPSQLTRDLMDSRFANCVVTLADLGAIAKWNGEKCYRSLPPRYSPRNTLGAGDVFSAVFMAALVSGSSIIGALRSASAAASLSVRHDSWDSWMRGFENPLGFLRKHAAAGEVEIPPATASIPQPSQLAVGGKRNGRNHCCR